MAEKKQKPSVGRIVHFKTEEGEVLPGIITQVHKDDTINLRVFTNNANSLPVVLLENVPEGKKEKQWSWPPQDGE